MLIELLTYPFMLRALLGGISVAGITSVIGVFALLRKASFFGDALAHASLTGVALGLLLGLDPFLTALVFSLMLALSFPFIEKKSNLHLDAILGFALPFSMALGIILLSLIPGYKPELMTYLFGNILAISWDSLISIGLMALVTLTILVGYWPKLVATAFDPTYARITGINILFFALLHNALLTLAVIPAVSIVGAILAGALLIIPAATTRQYVTSLKGMVIATPILAITCTVLGLLLSAAFNLPSGPAIVLLLGVVFLASLVFKHR